MNIASPQLRGRPDKIFISVDESTGRSTMSFQPATVCSPWQRDDDKTGAIALKEARTILDKYPGCTLHGPHFHAARPPGRMKMRRRTAPTEGGNSSES